MPTQPYKLKDGTRVPGVTTILGRWKDSGGLMHWAWECGMEGRDYRKVRDEAADAGTLAHAMVEAEIRRGEFPKPDAWQEDIWVKGQQAFANFATWAKHTNLEPRETELALVSEQYGFGGTLDAMLVAGELSLGDWKTSRGVYPEYRMQLAAYGVLWEENRDEPITGGYHLLRFDKDHGDFAHFHWSDLSLEREQFLAFVECYKRDRIIRKRA